MSFSTVALADDGSLIDLLKEKKILTEEEYERVKGSQLRPEERRELIEVLREKGVLDAADVERVEHAAEATPEESAAVAVQPTPIPQVGYEDGFFVRSKEGNYYLRLNGRASSNVLFEEPGTTLNNTINLDRARLSADLTFYKYFRGRVEAEFTATPVLRDAFLAVQPMPELNLQLGQFTVPFSYELIESKLRTDFVERSAVVNQAVNPRRDIGLMVHGQLLRKVLQYQLAVMNGTGQNRSDNNSEKDGVARLVVAPFIASEMTHLQGFNVGGAVTYGREAPGPGISGVTEPGFTFFPAVTTSGLRLRTGAHAAWLDGPFSISSEYIQTRQSRDGLGPGGSDLPDLSTDGAYVNGTWLMTGETKQYNTRVRPLRPVRLWEEDSGPGAWEAAVRYEYFTLRYEGDSTGSVAGARNRYDAFIAGVNWYPIEFMRFTLNYIYSTYGQQGVGLSPNPTKRSNNAVFSRAQVDF